MIPRMCSTRVFVYISLWINVKRRDPLMRKTAKFLTKIELYLSCKWATFFSLFSISLCTEWSCDIKWRGNDLSSITFSRYINQTIKWLNVYELRKSFVAAKGGRILNCSLSLYRLNHRNVTICKAQCIECFKLEFLFLLRL